MQRFKIFHETSYSYQNAVSLGAHKLMVRPRDGHDIRIESSKLTISPNALVSWHRDELDNSVAVATFDSTQTTSLTIVSEVTVAHYLSLPDVVPIYPEVSRFPFDYSDAEQKALAAYLEYEAQGDEFDSWVDAIAAEYRDTIHLLKSLSEKIFTQCSYEMREEPGVQSPAHTLEALRGSCRDYAWLFVTAARKLGFASRFVSGYFHTAGTVLEDGHTHAWAEVFLPGAGWTGFDPTCNRLTAENHIPVAVALLPEDIPPVSGHFVGQADEDPTLAVKVRVVPC